MCGIVGFYTKKKMTDPKSIITRMMDSQKHRGPDAEGLFLEHNNDIQIALGHRRLSIIDVASHANQPMTFENLTIVYNGEVYNFQEIKSELKQYGYDFFSDGDTEVILKAFHKWGTQALGKFRGMFAFCIYDKRLQKFYLIRDRAGVKPLYFYHSNNSLIFASEASAFKYFPGFKLELDQQALNLYLQYSYVPAPWTIYAGVKKIRPGQYIEFDYRNNQVSEHSYWNLATFYAQPKLQLSEHEAIDQLEAILLDAFALRMVADVPIGILLSGGVDSSLVASILQRQNASTIKTFALGFNNQEFNEAHYAKQIAAHLGTEHYEYYCSWKDAEKLIWEVPKIYDEPFADTSAIPTALIAQFVKQQVTVVLSGDGGDELFCGYTSYLTNERRFNQLNKLPFNRFMRQFFDAIPDPFMSGFKFKYDLYNRYLKLKSLLNVEHIEDKYQAITRTFTPYDLTKLLPQHKLIPNPNQIMHQLKDLERMMLIDFNGYLPDNLMVKVDRATMYHSLEAREPLLDHKLLEFAARLPIQFKQKKHILKQILTKYLPPASFERKKHGFGIPVQAWLRGELRYLLEDWLGASKIKQQGIFNPRYVAQIKQAFLKNNTNDPRIWTLLMFQMWYEKNFTMVK